MRFYRTTLFFLGIVIATCISSQPLPTLPGDTASLPGNVFSKYFDQANSKARILHEKFENQSGKVLQQLLKVEQQIEKKLVKQNGIKAPGVYTGTGETCEQFKQRLKELTSLQEYIPSLDTLSTSLKFLYEHRQLFSSANGVRQKLNDAITAVHSLELEIQKAEEIKKFIGERRQYLRNQFGNAGIPKCLKKFNKQVYYYSAQVNEYKTVLKDHDRSVRRALALLNTTKLFKNFMQKNSLLASVFRLPGDPHVPVCITVLAGLQTRDQVGALLRDRILSAGPDAGQQFQDNLSEAQTRLNEIREKLSIPGRPGDNEASPDGFRPNTQKTKPFLKRLEFGTRVQSQKTHGYLPVTTDLALTIGYRLNDRSTAGISASYKLGWGQSIRHITFTPQGAGLGCFMDWKVKGSFWFSGGYELHQYRELENIAVLKDLKAWQHRGLLGMSKMVSIRTKYFKKIKFQLLVETLRYKKLPGGQALVFRAAYDMK